MQLRKLWIIPKQSNILYIYGCFQKYGCKPSILGYPYFWKHPYILNITKPIPKTSSIHPITLERDGTLGTGERTVRSPAPRGGGDVDLPAIFSRTRDEGSSSNLRATVKKTNMKLEDHDLHWNLLRHPHHFILCSSFWLPAGWLFFGWI